MKDTHPSWQKLEPHSRNQDFSTGIQATIHDPLWMLTRQWQLGEFEGEDSGSPIHVKVEYIEGKISAVDKNDDNIIDYDERVPLEVFVERTALQVAPGAGKGDMQPQLDLQMQVRLGLQFQTEMDALLKGLLDPAEIRSFKRFLAQDPAFRFELNERLNEYEVEVTKKFVSIVEGRVINIYRATNLDDPTLINNKTTQYFNDNPNLPHSGQVFKAMNFAFDNLKHWWYGNRTPTDAVNKEESFFEIPPENFSLWNARHLEYDFRLHVTPNGTSNNLIFDASGYKEDHLDWYSFTVSESTEVSESPLQTQHPIANAIKFAGMPEKRWWNFEDSYVDFGSIDPKKNDIVSALLMEFVLVYSPDWYVIPHQMRVGTFNKIEKLTVLDCFGEETVINPAGHTASELETMAESDRSWDSWGMFTLSEKYRDKDEQHYTPYFFLPPTIDHVLTGPALEEVRMLRDETANLVWGVERMYRTFYGEPVSGYDHSAILQKKNKEELSSIGTGEEEDIPLKYSLMNSIARNWIPFIPVHITSEVTTTLDSLHKHIQLQRGSMINPVDGSRILPNSRLLSEVQPAYYVNEEEVPRTGIILSENCQRTVWHNGDIFLWIGRKKYYGAGEASSGLQFDSVSLNRKL